MLSTLLNRNLRQDVVGYCVLREYTSFVGQVVQNHALEIGQVENSVTGHHNRDVSPKNPSRERISGTLYVERK